MIFVTGASGNVGQAVVDQLSRGQIPYRTGARRPDTISPSPGAEVVAFDFLNPDTYQPAVAGCEAVFLLRPPAISNTKQTLNVFIEVAREAGVKQVVFVSVAGAADQPWVPHHAVEQHLKNGPPSWTILRPGFFAQNLGDAYRDDIVNDHRLYVPAGEGNVAFIDARDIAAAAVIALTDLTPHAGQSYTLTGPQAVSFNDVANSLTQELNRPIRYEAASLLGYVRHLRKRHMPWGQVVVQTILHRGLCYGEAEEVTDTLGNLLGRSPLTIADYIRDHRDLWLQP